MQAEPEKPYNPYPYFPGLSRNFKLPELRGALSAALSSVQGTSAAAQNRRAEIRNAATALSTRKTQINDDLKAYEEKLAAWHASRHITGEEFTAFTLAWERMNDCSSKTELIRLVRPHLFVNTDSSAVEKRTAWCKTAAEILAKYPIILEHKEAKFALLQVLRMVFFNYARGAADDKKLIDNLKSFLPGMPHLSEVLFAEYGGKKLQDIMRIHPAMLEKPERVKNLMNWAASSDHEKRAGYKKKYTSKFTEFAQK